MNRASKGDVFFLQNVATHLLDDPVQIDGVWGPDTSGATGRAARALGVAGSLDTRERWKALLGAIAERGFALDTAPEALGPAERLAAVYRVIDVELGDSPAKKRITSAVDVFVAHPLVREVVAEGGRSG